MPTTMPATGAEGGSKEIVAPKKPSIDYRPRNIPQATILLTETSIRESMQKYPNAKKANSTLIKNMKEWYADPRTANSPQRKAVKAYIMAATAKPTGKSSKAAPQTSVAATGGAMPPEDPNKNKRNETKSEKLARLINEISKKVSERRSLQFKKNVEGLTPEQTTRLKQLNQELGPKEREIGRLRQEIEKLRMEPFEKKPNGQNRSSDEHNSGGYTSQDIQTTRGKMDEMLQEAGGKYSNLKDPAKYERLGRKLEKLLQKLEKNDIQH
jgi:hypothetical protein